MKKNNWISVILIFGVGLIVGIFLGKAWKKNDTPKRYHKRVGHISPPAETLNKNTEPILDYYRGAYHTFSSAAPKIYKGSKHQFRKKILEKFNAQNYTESGYLTLRFFINPQSQVILHEIIEMDLDLIQTNLDDKMVEEIQKLSFDPENWDPYIDENHNYYMHLTYRIENGQITEITP